MVVLTPSGQFLDCTTSAFNERLYVIIGPYAVLKYSVGGPGSSVTIATELRVRRSGIESRWGRNFPPVQTGPGAHPASCTMGTESFPGVEVPGREDDPHPHLVPRS